MNKAFIAFCKGIINIFVACQATIYLTDWSIIKNKMEVLI